MENQRFGETMNGVQGANFEGLQNAERTGEVAERPSENRMNQGALGQATLRMPEPGAMPPGMELGVIMSENDREREELTGEKPIGTDRPKVQDREGLSPERLSYIERGIAQRMNDLHELKEFATVEMEAELKGRYGRIFGGEN